MTHNLKEHDRGYILTIDVKGFWSLFFQNFGTWSSKFRSFWTNWWFWRMDPTCGEKLLMRSCREGFGSLESGFKPKAKSGFGGAREPRRSKFGYILKYYDKILEIKLNFLSCYCLKLTPSDLFDCFRTCKRRYFT